jgi:hypothetical protein
MRIDYAGMNGAMRGAARKGLALATFLLLPAGAALGQEATSRSPDFLFGEPKGSLGVRGGWGFARAGSDVFDFINQQLTVDDRDFDGPGFAFDIGYQVKPWLMLQARVGHTESSVTSEFRDYVDQDDNPILQETRLKRTPMTLGLKLYLKPRGQAVSRFAWVPRSFAPYVGVGGGMIRYELQQAGDFVDFADLSIFSDAFVSEGWTGTMNAFAGVDVKIHRRAFVSLEVGYLWADAELGQDFEGFEPIDLSGLQTSLGVDLVF